MLAAKKTTPSLCHLVAEVLRTRVAEEHSTCLPHVHRFLTVLFVVLWDAKERLFRHDACA